ncbi:hypothetical protein CHM34_17140 [Paludifilum halophilum]|uniref:Uncharacterized protein n=1 Tax=Paludifilum halophilum TaxID=1642702 RepID=A0A235B2U9_9BACL|nr:hypothetical protein CHM34_17140 [Paludifilum halophilum]
MLALDPAAKLHLSRTFERVQTDFESEDVKEARAIIEQAERLESAKLFKPLEADAVREVTKEYFAVDLNQPERLYSTEEWKGMEPDPHPDLKRLEAEEKADQKMAKDDGELSIMDLWKFDENGKLVRREQ